MDTSVLLLEPQQWLPQVLATWCYLFWGDPMFLPATWKVVKAHVVQSFPVSSEAVVTAHKLHSPSHSSLESVSKGFCLELSSAGWSPRA